MHTVVHVDIFAVGKGKGVISTVRISDVSFQLSRWASSSGTGGAITRETGREGGRLTISQQTYTEELGEKYGVEWGNAIPIPTTWRLWDFDVDEPNVLLPIRELIGALLWIALLTRPDIANSVRAVARYCSAPKLIHWKAARSILGYALRTSYFGISVFRRGR